MGYDFDMNSLYQMVAALVTVLIVGFILVKIKLFHIEQFWPFHHLVNIIFYPGFIFYVIGTSSFTMESWKPFFPVVILQFLTHLVIFLVCFFSKHPDLSTRYLKAVLTFGFSEYTAFVYQITLVVVGDQYSLICVFYMIMDIFVYYPILRYLIWTRSKISEELNEPLEQIDEANEKMEELEKDEQNNEEYDAAGNPLDEKEPNGDEITEQVEDVDKKDEESLKVDEELENEKEFDEADEFKTRPLWKMLLLSFVSSRTLSVVAGIVWSATGAKFPELIRQFSSDYRYSICATVLTIAGGYCASIGPGKFTPLIFVSVAVRYIVQPLCMAGLCKLFGISSIVTKMCMLMSCAPISINAFKRMENTEDWELPKTIVFWTYIFYIPVIFTWTLILFETSFLS